MFCPWTFISYARFPMDGTIETTTSCARSERRTMGTPCSVICSALYGCAKDVMAKAMKASNGVIDGLHATAAPLRTADLRNSGRNGHPDQAAIQGYAFHGCIL